jgi:hypothetical protein
VTPLSDQSENRGALGSAGGVGQPPSGWASGIDAGAQCLAEIQGRADDHAADWDPAAEWDHAADWGHAVDWGPAADWDPAADHGSVEALILLKERKELLARLEGPPAVLASP